jgi:hypothetical protein
METHGLTPQWCASSGTSIASGQLTTASMYGNG